MVNILKADIIQLLEIEVTEVNMVRSELIRRIAKKVPILSDKDVELGVNQILQSITEALANGDRVEIRSFGSFSLHYHPARPARNPKTGEHVVTAAKYSPYFRAAKGLRVGVEASRLRAK